MKARAEVAKRSRARKNHSIPAGAGGKNGDDDAEVELTVFHVNHILYVSFSCFIFVEGAPLGKKARWRSIGRGVVKTKSQHGELVDADGDVDDVDEDEGACWSLSPDDADDC